MEANQQHFSIDYRTGRMPHTAGMHQQTIVSSARAMSTSAEKDFTSAIANDMSSGFESRIKEEKIDQQEMFNTGKYKTYILTSLE